MLNCQIVRVLCKEEAPRAKDLMVSLKMQLEKLLLSFTAEQLLTPLVWPLKSLKENVASLDDSYQNNIFLDLCVYH